MDYQSFKQAVIARAKELGIDEYELYYESGSDTTVGVFQHEVSQFSSSTGGGVCFRCIVNGKMGYASTQALSEEEARTIVQQAADNAAVLERHGMIAVSPRDVDDAFRMAVHVEETAKAYYRMASLIGLEQVKAEV